MKVTVKLRMATLGLALLSSTAFVTLGGTSSAKAATWYPTACLSLNPYLNIEMATQLCGYTAIREQAMKVNKYGGDAYEYTLPDGTEMSFNTLPSTFNASSASNSELKYFGLPSRPMPSDPTGLSAWTSKYGNLQFSAPPQVLLISPYKNISSTSGNWSGAVATSTSTSTYTLANGTYTQPSNNVSNCNIGTDVSLGSIWSGLGGETNTANLAQDGTYFGSNVSGLNGEFWYEFAPNGPVVLNKFANVNDSVEAEVSYDGGSVFTMNIMDFTNGVTYSNIVTAPSGWTFDGTIADFIVERPLVNNSVFANLPNFGQTTFQYAEVESGGTISYLSSYPNLLISMVASSGDTLATPVPGVIGSNGGFPDHYLACS